MLRRHASRALIRVTRLCVDAANRHHRFAADIDRAAAECECEDGSVCGRATPILVQSTFTVDPMGGRKNCRTASSREW